MGNKCATKWCRGAVTASGHSKYCSKCRSSRFRQKHPIQAHYHDLRNRAKQRGHEFTLSLKEYETFWFESGYGEKHGKTKDSFSIDRIRPELGYVPGNIRARTLSLNSRLRYVPFWKNKAEQEAALADQDLYNAKCQEIADALSKIYPEDSDEWRAEYTARTNALND